MKRLIIAFWAMAIFGCTTPETDWCYEYSFLGGLPPGFSLAYGFVAADGLRGELGGGDLYIEYAGPSVTPSYISVTITYPNSGQTAGYIEGDWWGSSFSSVAVPTGESVVVVSTTGSGTNKYVYGYIPESARIKKLTFYGNGANPFPGNDCLPPPTNTPSPTSTPVQIYIDTSNFIGQINDSSNRFSGAFSVVVAIGIAFAILGYLGWMILRAIRGDE